MFGLSSELVFCLQRYKIVLLQQLELTLVQKLVEWMIKLQRHSGYCNLLSSKVNIFEKGCDHQGLKSYCDSRLRGFIYQGILNYSDFISCWIFIDTTYFSLSH